MRVLCSVVKNLYLGAMEGSVYEWALVLCKIWEPRFYLFTEMFSADNNEIYSSHYTFDLKLFNKILLVLPISDNTMFS